jgi:hypothetical protein
MAYSIHVYHRESISLKKEELFIAYLLLLKTAKKFIKNINKKYELK